MKIITLIVALILSNSHLVAAGEDEKGLMLCAEGKVNKILAADRFELDSGEIVRLMMVKVPHMPQGSETGRPWPMAEQIEAFIRSHFTGETFTFYCLERTRDRHGELVAMAKMADGGWLQSQMIKQGWAWVSSTRDFTHGASALYDLEDEARRQGHGLWAFNAYSLKDAAKLNNKVGRFEIVEGKVMAVATVKNVTYINFGNDWRKDFTLKMDWRARKAFEKAGIPVESFAGKRVQVRGWISWYAGPMIELTHVDQIRFLDEGDQ